jgi:ribosomal protein L40E
MIFNVFTHHYEPWFRYAMTTLPFWLICGFLFGLWDWRSFLRRYARATEAAAAEANAEITTCLSCGMLLEPRQHRCQKCGWSYEDLSEVSSRA